MGIGQLKCSVLDVTDLEAAEAFWSQVTGLSVLPSVFPGRYSYLGEADPWRQEMILHLVRTPKDPAVTNRAHVDVWVRDVDEAIAAIEAIGGSVKRGPSIYPRPGSYGDEEPRIDWAVMRDPFLNEFCLVSVLSTDERTAVRNAAEVTSDDNPVDDAHWRSAAGRMSSGR